MRKLLWVVGLLLLAVPAHAQYPPDESAFVVAMAAQTGDLIKNDSYAFTDAVCAALAQKDPNWGRKVRSAGDWSSRNSDAIAYRFGSDDNKALVDIVYNSTDPGGPPNPNAAPAWQVYPGPNTGNGYWMKCYEPPRRGNRPGHDFDGDGMLDLGVFRPSNGNWYVFQSSTRTPYAVKWGVSTDVPVPGDYDGDGRADVAVWRPSEGVWYIVRSSTGIKTANLWGANGDVPVPADYDGDGRTDLAVWRPTEGRWYWLRSADNYSWNTYQTVQWGRSGDIPVPADYDGDGKADLCLWRPSEGRWYWLKSTAAYAWTAYGTVQWGVAGDIAVPADYDGDGKSDFVVFRPSAGTWYAMLSSTWQLVSVYWGIAGDKPL